MNFSNAFNFIQFCLTFRFVAFLCSEGSFMQVCRWIHCNRHCCIFLNRIKEFVTKAFSQKINIVAWYFCNYKNPLLTCKELIIFQITETHQAWKLSRKLLLCVQSREIFYYHPVARFSELDKVEPKINLLITSLRLFLASLSLPLLRFLCAYSLLTTHMRRWNK